MNLPGAALSGCVTVLEERGEHFSMPTSVLAGRHLAMPDATAEPPGIDSAPVLTPSRAHLERVPNLALRFGARYPWPASTAETLRCTATRQGARNEARCPRAGPRAGKTVALGAMASARLGLPIVHLARISQHHHPVATTDPLGLAGRLVLRNPAPRKVQRSSLAARSASLSSAGRQAHPPRP